MLNVATATDRVKQCTIFEVVVNNLDLVFVADVAAASHATLHDYLRSRLKVFGPQIGELYAAALIVCDADAQELTTSMLAGDTSTSLAYRFKAYSLHAARDIADLLIARYKERAFGGRPLVELSRVSTAAVIPCAVRVHLSTLPVNVVPLLPLELYTALSTSFFPPLLSLSSPPGDRRHFSSSVHSTGQ